MTLRRLACLFVLAISAAASPAVHAELILDDFDDPAELPLTRANAWTNVTTDGVGSLAAQRQLRYSSSGATLTGGYTIDEGGNSLLVGRVDSVTTTFPSLFRNFTLSFHYNFNETDATQMGENDAILLDFRSTARVMTTVELVVFARDDVSGRLSASLRPPAENQPFTLTIPFASVREGTAGIAANFERLSRLSFNMRVSAPGEGDLNFAFELDRIRLGRVVPEPAGGICMIVTATGFAAFHRQKRHTN